MQSVNDPVLLSVVEEKRQNSVPGDVFKPMSKPYNRRRWPFLAGLAITTFSIFYLLRWHAVFFTSEATSIYGFFLQRNDPMADQVVRRYNLTVGARWLNLGLCPLFPHSSYSIKKLFAENFVSV